MDQNSAQPTDPIVSQPLTNATTVAGTPSAAPVNEAQKAQEDLSKVTDVTSQPLDTTNSKIMSSVSTVQVEASTPVKYQAPVSQPPPSISGASKEHAPIPVTAATEIIKPTEQEPVLAPELKEAGVETVPEADKLQIPQDLKAAGVEVIKTAAPVPVATSINDSLPMTEKEAISKIKTNPPNSSVRWFATEINKHYRRLKGLFVKESV